MGGSVKVEGTFEIRFFLYAYPGSLMIYFKETIITRVLKFLTSFNPLYKILQRSESFNILSFSRNETDTLSCLA